METNYSLQLWMETIKQSLVKRRREGGCGMSREVMIPYLVKTGKWDELLDYEKEYFKTGVKDGKWTSKGVHLKDNNPYCTNKVKKERITEF